MIETHATSLASAERLWATLSDVTVWPRHLPTFIRVTPADGSTTLAPGARFVVRQPGLLTATYEVTDWAAGSSFTWVARSPGLLTTATHRVHGVAGGSRVDLTVGWSGPLARPVGLILSSRVGRMIQLEATTLARVAHAGA